MLICFNLLHEDDQIMTDFFFPKCTGSVIYMRLPGGRRALRDPSAETRLTDYNRRVFPDTDMTFRYYFSDFFGVARLFWLGIFLVLVILFFL